MSNLGIGGVGGGGYIAPRGLGAQRPASLGSEAPVGLSSDTVTSPSASLARRVLDKNPNNPVANAGYQAANGALTQDSLHSALADFFKVQP